MPFASDKTLSHILLKEMSSCLEAWTKRRNDEDWNMDKSPDFNRSSHNGYFEFNQLGGMDGTIRTD